MVAKPSHRTSARRIRAGSLQWARLIRELPNLPGRNEVNKPVTLDIAAAKSGRRGIGTPTSSPSRWPSLAGRASRSGSRATGLSAQVAAGRASHNPLTWDHSWSKSSIASGAARNFNPFSSSAPFRESRSWQVLHNMLFNALDAQPDGGRIRVALESDEPGRNIFIRVEDDGPGLTA